MSLFVDKDIFTTCDAKVTSDEHQVTINCIFSSPVESFVVKKNTSKLKLLPFDARCIIIFIFIPPISIFCICMCIKPFICSD